VTGGFEGEEGLVEAFGVPRGAGADAVVAVVEMEVVAADVVVHAGDPSGVCVEAWGDAAGVVGGVEGGDNVLAVRAFPKTDVEGDGDGGLPSELLGGKAEDAGVGQNAGDGDDESEAVREEVVGGGAAKLALVEEVAVKNLPEHRFEGGDIDLAFVDASAGGMPAAGGDVALEAGGEGGEEEEEEGGCFHLNGD
jgi:hypothetical protein